MFSQAITPSNGPKAIGPYSAGIKLGDFVYLSGQLGIDPVSNELVGNDIQTQTKQVMANIEAVLVEMNLELRHVVKTTVFLTDLNDFEQFNEVYGAAFAQPYPARSCVQVAALPKGAKVEIECLVIDTLIYERQMAASSCGGCSGGCGDDCDCDSKEGGCGEGCSCQE